MTQTQQTRRIRSPRQRGIVLVLTLLAIFLLAGLLFYVLNIGRHINSRITLQQSADAAAVGGAGWVARTFNQIAMNNVTTTNYLAMVNVFDALPRATEAARHEQTFLRAAAQDRLTGINTGTSSLDAVIYDQLNLLYIELDEEVELNLTPMDDFFAGYDMRQITHYNGPGGRGQLWRAMVTLEMHSLASLQSMPELAQRNCVQAGEVNMRADGDDQYNSAFMVPYLPQLEYVYRTHPDLSHQTSFHDYRRPVAEGRIPDWADHPVTNRGPYDAIYGWRFYTEYDGNRVVGTRPNVNGTTNGVNTRDTIQAFGGGPRNNAGSGGRVVRRNPTEYGTYGTHSAMNRRISGFAGRSRFGYTSNNSTSRPSLQESRLASWVSQLSGAKLNRIWPQEGNSFDQFAMPTWELDYPSVSQLTDPLPFGEIAYFRLDIKSRIERGSAGFMSGGSWAIDDGNDDRDDRESRMRIIRSRNWWVQNYDRQGDDDPQYLQYPDQLSGIIGNVRVTAINGSGRRAWLYEYEYLVEEDLEIGIELQLDANGDPIPQTAYFIQYVAWAGVNENPIPAGAFESNDAPGHDADRVAAAIADDSLTPPILNPYQGFDPTGPDSFGPVDIDHSQFDKSFESEAEAPALRQQIRDFTRDNLTFLGVAQHGSRALMWRRQFDRYKVQQSMYATAQAQVFNNHSFDLWTQMWHAQLMPCDDIGGWVERGEAELADTQDLPFIDPVNVENALLYLGSLERLAEIGLVH